MLVALAVAAGTADAVSYLGLGHVFVANMTGNTVLLGVALASGDGGAGARSGVSLAGFCAGVAIGAGTLRLARERGVATVLALEVLALAGLLGGWLAGGSRYVLIPVAAAAMGLQSAGVASSGAEVATTYITGTLTRGIVRVRLALPGAIWAFYVAGATAGAFAQRTWNGGGVVIPLAIVASMTAIVHGRTTAVQRSTGSR